MEKENTVTVTLTIDELKIVFNSLGKMPFADVFELIGKLNKQVNDQLPASDKQVK